MSKKQRYWLERKQHKDIYELLSSSERLDREQGASFRTFQKAFVDVFCGKKFREVTGLTKSELRPGQVKEVEIKVRLK